MANKMVLKIVGFLMIVFSIFIPSYIMKNFDFRNLLSYEHTFSGSLLLTLVTLLLVVVGFVAYYLINIKKNTGLKVVGYIMIFAIAFTPALLMIPYDKSSNALGTAYLTLVAVSVLSWAGFSVALKKRD